MRCFLLLRNWEDDSLSENKAKYRIAQKKESQVFASVPHETRDFIIIIIFSSLQWCLLFCCREIAAMSTDSRDQASALISRRIIKALNCDCCRIARSSSQQISESSSAKRKFTECDARAVVSKAPLIEFKRNCLSSSFGAAHSFRRAKAFREDARRPWGCWWAALFVSWCQSNHTRTGHLFTFHQEIEYSRHGHGHRLCYYSIGPNANIHIQRYNSQLAH